MSEEVDTSVFNSSRRGSTASDLGQHQAGDEGEDHIRVICRVRPPNAREGRSALGLRTCVSVDEGSKTVRLKAAAGPKLFTFDHSVGPDCSQETLFQLAGKPATRACMQGYNGTVFCYGQTGSGKTFTMFGPNVDACSPDGAPDEQRGLVPRVLEYLFAHVAREERRNGGSVKYLCRCSFYEIFNERVFDLLDAGCSLGGLQTREDMKKGVYVEGLTEEAVDSPHQAYQVLTRGYRNRHVGETAMNRESSRSHAVFTVVLESREQDAAGGVTRSRCAAFNLVDLAGSERQSATGATGERLKEASSINKSLSALGNVINALVSGKTRYVPYRDSRLTFLLRDSLGGNAKTFLVACTSPNDENFAETLSTLKFAQRAKMIKNKAVVNEDTTGTVEALQRELRQLRKELLAHKAVISANGGSVLPRPLAGEEKEQYENAAQPNKRAFNKNAAEARKTEALLRDALDRCLRLEEARGVAEAMAGNVQETVTRLEQALMNERMARKMKESQVARLQKKEPAAGSAPSSAEAELRAEVDALRKEAEQVPLEVVKWRAAAENAQAQLDALVDEKGLGMWVEAREQTFATRLEEQLKAALADKAALEERFLGEGAGSGEGGGGGKHSRRLSDGGMTRLREAEGKAQLLAEELAAAKRAAEEAEAQLAEARAAAAEAVSTQSQLQVRVTLAERRVEALEGEKRVLKADRDFTMAMLEEKQQAQQARAQEEQTAKQDVEAQLASACKDNAVLLQRLKETAGEADEMAARRAAVEARAQALEEKLEALTPQMAALEAAVEEGKAALVAQQADAEAKEAALTEELAAAHEGAAAAQAAHTAEATQLRQGVDAAQARAQALGAEKEEAALALAGLQEEQDTMREELEFTRGKMAELEAGLAAAQAERERADRERAKAEAAVEDAQAKLAELEEQLDIAGGDAAATRQAMRALEAATQEMGEERASLQEAMEALKVELADEKEKGDKAAKEATRASQVLSDLGEQVNKLRGEAAEVRAREQAARTEADGLSQERADLLARAEEAEERVAEMGEEMMAYLDEITMLKTKITGEAQAHAEGMRRIQASHDEALGSAQQEAVALAQQLQGLQAEVASLQARLQQQGEQAEQQAMVSLEESRAMVHAAEKQKLEELSWAHTQEVAALQKTLAEAEARGAEGARFKAALGASQAEGQQLRVQMAAATEAWEVAETQLAAADERCASLARQVAEAQAQLKEQEAWEAERQRWEAEVGRAREMEKEAYDKYEAVEQLRSEACKAAEALEKELEEVKAANVKLVGHANARQKIQLHRKLKDELIDMQRRCKALEEENYALKQQQPHGAKTAAAAAPITAAEGAKVLAAVTNASLSTRNRPATRASPANTSAAAGAAGAGSDGGKVDIRDKLLALRGQRAQQPPEQQGGEV